MMLICRHYHFIPHLVIVKVIQGQTDRIKAASGSESSCANERSYKFEDFSSSPSPDMEVLDEGSVAEASGPEPTELPTKQNLADVTKNVRANRLSGHVSQVQFTV